MDSARFRDLAKATQHVGGVARGVGVPFAAPQDPARDEDPTRAGGSGKSPFPFRNSGKTRRAATKRGWWPPRFEPGKSGGEKEFGSRRPP